MNFELSDEQVVIRDLAAQVVGGEITQERLKAVEAAGDFDRALWAKLAEANLLGLCLPESAGGSGYGMVELALVLEQQGRCTAPVPLLATVATAGALALHVPDVAAAAASGSVLTCALAEPGANDALHPSVLATPFEAEFRLSGFKPAVPFAAQADCILVPARFAGGDIGLFVVDPSSAGVTLEPVSTTSHEPAAHLTLDGAAGAGPYGDEQALGALLERVLTGLCALQVGVCDAALARTAEFVSTRQQFSKPLATFQAVAQQAADAYVAVEAMRVTMLQAAWRLDQGLPARREVLIAKYWASEAGQRVVHIAQHLHGGIGADTDYPIHRHFLWGIQIDTTLGGASQQLARLGQLIASR